MSISLIIDWRSLFLSARLGKSPYSLQRLYATWLHAAHAYAYAGADVTAGWIVAGGSRVVGMWYDLGSVLYVGRYVGV